MGTSMCAPHVASASPADAKPETKQPWVQYMPKGEPDGLRTAPRRELECCQVIREPLRREYGRLCRPRKPPAAQLVDDEGGEAGYIDEDDGGGEAKEWIETMN